MNTIIFSGLISDRSSSASIVIVVFSAIILAIFGVALLRGNDEELVTTVRHAESPVIAVGDDGTVVTVGDDGVFVLVGNDGNVVTVEE